MSGSVDSVASVALLVLCAVACRIMSDRVAIWFAVADENGGIGIVRHY